MTSADIRIKKIVKETVREVFMQLDVNLNDPEDIIEFRKDQQYLRSQRLRVDMMVHEALKRIVILAIPAAIAYVWLSFSR